MANPVIAFFTLYGSRARSNPWDICGVHDVFNTHYLGGAKTNIRSHLGGSFLLQTFGSRTVNHPWCKVDGLSRQTHGRMLANCIMPRDRDCYRDLRSGQLPLFRTESLSQKGSRSTGREGRKGCPPQSVRARPSPGLRPTQLAHPPVLARTLPFACGPRPGHAPPRSHTLPPLRACRDTAVAVQPLPNPPASVAPALVLCAPLTRTDSRPSCAYTRRAEGCARCEVREPGCWVWVREPGCGVWVREQGCRGGASVCAKGGRACVRGWRSPCGGCWGSRCPPAHPFARKRERARGRRNGPPREGDLNKRVGGVYCPLTVPLIRVARPFPSTHARPFHTDRECAKVSLAWRPVASPSRALPLSRERVRRGTARPPTPSARATPTPHARPTPLRANRCATPAPLFPHPHPAPRFSHPHPAPRFSHLAPRTPLCASGVGAGRAGVGARKGGTQNEGRCNTSRRIRQGLHRYRRVPACAQRR
ncbi:hypothetical protein BJY52DRAFT_1413326 [Lactarius psammicola]|nr:hypothetical protein BJY52DRAFT_1413326 [Lactarius psammicola]